MVLSVLGFSINGTDNSMVKYKNMKFTRTEKGIWTAIINNKPVYLLNNPKDLENISDIKIDIKELNKFNKVYFSSNPKEPIVNELAGFNTNILPLLTAAIRPACFIDMDECRNYPLKNCSDADSATGIILVKKSNINKMDYINNCLTIQGSSEGLKKLIDKWVLELYING